MLQQTVLQNLRGMELVFGGELLVADCSGALYWPAERAVIVSDLHFEKASFFASRGLMLPPYDTAATLQSLAQVLATYTPARVIALGDSFHDSAGGGRLSHENRAFVRLLQEQREWIWIAGNHDPDRIEDIGGDFASSIEIRNLTFRHEPGKQATEVIGHFHPVARVQVRRRTLRRRCFVNSATRLVLPAFGSLTGGLNVRDDAFAEVLGRNFFAHMLGAEQVFSFAAANCLPD